MCQSYLLLVPVNLVSGGVDDSGGRCLPLLMGLASVALTMVPASLASVEVRLNVLPSLCCKMYLSSPSSLSVGPGERVQDLLLTDPFLM